MKLNHGQRKYDRLQWILRRYNHLQTPRTMYSLEPLFHPLSNAPMLAYVRYSLTIKLVWNKLIRKQKKCPILATPEIQFDFKTCGYFEVRRRNSQWPGAAGALKWNDENNPKPPLGAPPDARTRTDPARACSLTSLKT